MSTPSNWPLSPASVRYLVPIHFVEKLRNGLVSNMLYPTAFGYYEHATGHEVIRDRHDDHLLIFCTDGKGEIETQQSRFEIDAGNVVILPKGTPHSYRANSNNPWTIYWVHFQGDRFEDIVAIIQGKSQQVNLAPIVLPAPLNKQYEETFQQLLQIQKYSYQLNAYHLGGAILQRLLIELSVQYPVNSQNKKQLQFDEIDYYLQQHITKTLTLDDMAMAFGLSKFYFAKKFQIIVGVSPIRYFTEKKIHHACDQLDSSEYSIKRIAKHLGYDDAYYFSRQFKNIMGLSPQQYRKSKHGG